MKPSKLSVAAAVWCLFSVVLLICPSSSAQGLGRIEIAEHESGRQKTRFTDKKETLYNYSWDLTRSGTRVTYKARGDNNKSGPKRVDWTETSVMELVPQGLRTLSWTKESTGAEQETWKIEYDWAARKATHTYHDRAKGKKESGVVEFGAKAYSGDAMYLMLRGFPFERGVGTKIEGEFVLTDGQIFKGAIIHRGEERLQTAFGPVDTFKLEFKIGGAIGGLAPKMYMWFTKAAPHVFVRYDGREEGLTKPRTTNELVESVPAVLPADVPADLPAAR